MITFIQIVLSILLLFGCFFILVGAVAGSVAGALARE